MQRAKEKETMEKASEETARRTDEAKKSEEWHAPGFAPGALLANGARGIQLSLIHISEPTRPY